MKKKHITEGECLPESLPGIDIGSGVKKVSGNKPLYKKMLVIMQKQYNNAAGIIRDSLTSGDLNTALLIAHNLKGVSGNIAAMELSASSSKLENAIINKQEDDFSDLLNKLEKDLNQVFESVGILNNISSIENKITEETTNLDIDKVKLIMIELSGLIKKNSLDVDNCMEDLKAHLDQPKFQEGIKKLENYLDAFDYETAELILSTIANDLNVSLERIDK